MDNQNGTVPDESTSDSAVDEQIIDAALQTGIVQNVASESAIDDTPMTGASEEWVAPTNPDGTPMTGGSGEAPAEEPMPPVLSTPPSGGTGSSGDPLPELPTDNSEVPDETPRPTIPEQPDISNGELPEAVPIHIPLSSSGSTPSTGGSGEWTANTGTGHSDDEDDESQEPRSGGVQHESDSEDIAHTPSTGGSGEWDGDSEGTPTTGMPQQNQGGRRRRRGHKMGRGMSGGQGNGNSGGLGLIHSGGQRGRFGDQGNADTDDALPTRENWQQGQGQNQGQGKGRGMLGGAASGGSGMSGDGSNATPNPNITMPGYGSGHGNNSSSMSGMTGGS